MNYLTILQISEAQSGITELASQNSGSGSIFAILGAAILVIGLITVVWNVARNKPHSGEYILAWGVGLIFYIIFLNF